MKLYKIITEFQSYKWSLFALFMIFFVLGAVLKSLGLNATIPVLICVGIVVVWCIIWLIGWIYYKRYIKRRLDSWQENDNCDDEFFDYI